MPGVMKSQKDRYSTHSLCPPYNDIPFSRLIKTGIQTNFTFQNSGLQKLNIFGKPVTKHNFFAALLGNKGVYLVRKNKNKLFMGGKKNFD